jgi:hypothetical protein
MAVFHILLAVGVVLDVVAIVSEFHAETVLAPVPADIRAPFALAVLATILVVASGVALVLRLTRDHKAYVGLACLAFTLLLPVAMSLGGAPLNAHTWTFYVVWPMLQSFLVAIASVIFVLASLFSSRRSGKVP